MEKISCPLATQAKNNPNQPAILFSGRSMAYAHFNQSVWSTAKHLKKLGISANKRVGIYANNSIEYVITLFAIWRIQAVACPISTRLPLKGLQLLLEEIRPDILLVSRDFSADFKKSRVSWFTIEEMINFDIRDFPLAELPDVDLHQDATILQTSGSSGSAKSVLHTYGNYYFNALGANQNIPVLKEDRWLLSLPLYHVGGLGILFRILLGAGTIVIPEEEEKESLENSISKYKISHLSVVPTQLFRIIQNKNPSHNLDSLKFILVGGGSIPKNLLEEGIKLNLPLYVSYGLTEMTSQVATSENKMTDPSSPKAKVLNGRSL